MTMKNNNLLMFYVRTDTKEIIEINKENGGK